MQFPTMMFGFFWIKAFIVVLLLVASEIPCCFAGSTRLSLKQKQQQAQQQPMPTQAQQRYADNEIMALIHFNMATYIDDNDGDPTCNVHNWENMSQYPSTFAPTQLDTDQWATVFTKLGAKHAVLTAKHGCGFILWPTKIPLNTTHAYTYKSNVDILQSFTQSMIAKNIGTGFYYSMTNNFYINLIHNTYGTTYLPGQVQVTQTQFETMALGHLQELWTNYATNLTEIWFDGGYTTSMKERIQSLVEKYQPNAAIFGGYGISKNPIAWIGTESGFPDGDDVWSTGCSGVGQINSTLWCPKGCDTTLQVDDTWFYDSTKAIRSLSDMVNVYHATVGRNGVLELGIHIDKTGKIASDHATRYEQLGSYIKQCYGTPLQSFHNITTRNTDKNNIVLQWSQPITVDRIILREDQMTGGQRVTSYRLFVQVETGPPHKQMWILFSSGQSIGNKRIDINPNYNTTKIMKLHLKIDNAIDTPIFREISLFAPCPNPDEFQQQWSLHQSNTTIITAITAQ